MNYWFWLNIIIIPVLMFFVKPNTSKIEHIAKIFFATTVCSVFLNLALHLKQEILWDIYEACQGQFSDGDIRQHAECPKVANPDASYDFMKSFGWIPALVYVGWWELIWRIYHHHHIEKYPGSYKGKWHSDIIIIIAIITTSLTFFYNGMPVVINAIISAL